MGFETIIKKNKSLTEMIRGFYEKNRQEVQDKLKKEEFLADFHKACLDLEAARNNYNYAKEPALLEYYIYEIKAAETRVNYFLKLAKEDQFTNAGFFQGMFERNSEKGEGLL